MYENNYIFLKTYRVFNSVKVSLFKVPTISKRTVILKSSRVTGRFLWVKKYKSIKINTINKMIMERITGIVITIIKDHGVKKLYLGSIY